MNNQFITEEGKRFVTDLPTASNITRVRAFITETLKGRYDLSLEERREFVGQLGEFCPMPDDLHVTETTLGEVKTWILTPALITKIHNSKEAVILYIHGGAFVSGSIKSHGGLAGRIAKAANAPVYFIEYKLAPEYPFPAGLYDVTSAYRSLINKYGSSKQIGLCGDSAGGNLLLSALRIFNEEADPMPGACAALSPTVDLTCSLSSFERNSSHDVFITRQGLQEDIEQYLAAHDAKDPLASPLYGAPINYPPLLIQVGGDEVLLDDAREFTNRAAEAGGTVKLEIYERMIHGWHFFIKTHYDARLAIENVGRFFSDYLRRSVLMEEASKAEVLHK